MVYPRISGDTVIPRLSGVLKILKVMDHAYGAYVLQRTPVRAVVLSSDSRTGTVVPYEQG